MGGKGRRKGRGDAEGGGDLDDWGKGGSWRGSQSGLAPSRQAGYPSEDSDQAANGAWRPNLSRSRVPETGQDGSWRDSQSNGHVKAELGGDRGGRNQESSRPFASGIGQNGSWQNNYSGGGRNARGEREWERNPSDSGIGQNGSWQNNHSGGGRNARGEYGSYAARDKDQDASWHRESERGGPGHNRSDDAGGWRGDWRNDPRQGGSETRGGGDGRTDNWRGGSGGGGSAAADSGHHARRIGKNGPYNSDGMDGLDRNGYREGPKGSRSERDNGSWRDGPEFGGGQRGPQDTIRSHGDRKGGAGGKGRQEEDFERSAGGKSDRKGGAGGRGQREEDDRRGHGDRKGAAGGKSRQEEDGSWRNGDGKGRAGGKSQQEDDGYRSRGDGKGRASGKGQQEEDGYKSHGEKKGGGYGKGQREDRDGSHAGGKASHQRGEAESTSQPSKGKTRSRGHDDTGGHAQPHPSQQEQGGAPEPKGRSGGTGAVSSAHLSDTRFSSLDISQQLKVALDKGFGYEFMTQVQAATIGPLLAGQDVVARAKTGTGKTLAFLVPVVERIHRYPGGIGGPISSLVLSPTRELAAQIAEEGKVLLSYYKNMGIGCFYGGTNIAGDERHLSQKLCDILVATPGRMQDHLDNTRGFKQRLSEMSFLVLDEADQLLDMGFRDAILKILRQLPLPGKRQGALFSATFPDAVGQISKIALRPDNSVVNTVKPDDEVTPSQIDQCVSITDLEGMTELLWAAVNYEMKRLPKEHKIMVFFTAARLTQLYSAIFMHAGVQVLEIHSRKSQAHRTKCTETFRSSQSAIIFSSDVCARGLDYPNVTAVIQVGIPSSRDQYIHRLGRTGRAGRSGRCILLLHDFERFFLKQLTDLPVKQVTASSAFAGARAAPHALWDPPDWKSAGQAYQAWLGYYNSVKGLGWKKEQLVQEATRFAASIGAVDDRGLPPPILKKTVGMMGLRGVPGLNVVTELPYND